MEASLSSLAVGLDTLSGTLVSAQGLLLKIVDTVGGIPVIGPLIGAHNGSGREAGTQPRRSKAQWLSPPCAGCTKLAASHCRINPPPQAKSSLWTRSKAFWGIKEMRR